MSTTTTPFPTLRWVGDVDGHLTLIDQTLLPTELKHIKCHDVPSVWEAIRSLRVRGAPAIGIAAAYGAVLGGQTARGDDVEAVRRAVRTPQGEGTRLPGRGYADMPRHRPIRRGASGAGEGVLDPLQRGRLGPR